MRPTIQIGGTFVGKGCPTYIIAELSANHNQDLEIAIKTIHAAKDAGVNAIKLQTYKPESLTLDSELPHFRTREDTIWAGQKLFDLYQKAYMPWEWHSKLMDLASMLGLDCFSSPFDFDGVALLESLETPAYKIASLEITDIPLIELVASKGKPVIISTGAAEPEDIELALETCLKQGNDQVALLKCTSAYPTSLDEMNLQAISTIRDSYGTIVGLSDHSLDPVVPVTAVALGAKIIEKHIILDKSIDTVDRAFSLDPHEFKRLVDDVRKTEMSLGNGSLEDSVAVKKAQKSRRSLFAVRDISAGTMLSNELVRSLRPGIGLHPKHLKKVLGMRAKLDIERGQPLDWDMVEE